MKLAFGSAPSAGKRNPRVLRYRVVPSRLTQADVSRSIERQSGRAMRDGNGDCLESARTRVKGFDGWPRDAIALVERAMAAHGGLRQWQAITTIRLRFQNASGPLLRLKGYRHTFPAPREFEIRPHDRATILHGYPDERHCGHFAGGNVRIEHVDSREVLIESKEHRRTFTGLAKYRRWSVLDALYFFGYAL